MKQLLLTLLLIAASSSVLASADGDLEYSGVNVTDRQSLQGGLRTYMDYCIGCHSAKYMRYQRLVEDLEISEAVVEQFVLPSGAKIGDTMTIAMYPEDGERWFGKAPPDLSLIARARSEDWLFTYFKSFYRDPAGGWNNALFPDLSMPNVLWQLQGIQEPVFSSHLNKKTGETEYTIDHLAMTEPGLQTSEEYDKTVRDLVAFLSYLGEPAKLKRKALGWKVLLFLSLFAFLAYLLKAEYWRDIH